MTPPPAIELHKVRKSFGATSVLTGLDLCVRPGCAFGLLGRNGSGKTTTVRILLGLIGRDAGDVRVFGWDPIRDGARVRGSCAVVLDHDGLYDRLTVFDNLDLHARLRHLDAKLRRRRIDELLSQFELRAYDRVRPSKLSRGNRQKVAIARALLQHPPLLILDEPYAGLDPVAAIDMCRIITRLAHQEGTTILLTSHDLAHVEKTCDEVAILAEGNVRVSGPIIDVLRGRSLEQLFLETVAPAGDT